jgi:hypothetical protein
VKRLVTGFMAAFGISALVRLLRRRAEPLEPPAPPAADPAEELRRRLAEARSEPDDREEFDAAEGQPVDEVGEPRSIDERRRAIHERAQEALGEMRGGEGE